MIELRKLNTCLKSQTRKSPKTFIPGLDVGGIGFEPNALPMVNRDAPFPNSFPIKKLCHHPLETLKTKSPKIFIPELYVGGIGFEPMTPCL